MPVVMYQSETLSCYWLVTAGGQLVKKKLFSSIHIKNKLKIKKQIDNSKKKNPQKTPYL